MSPPYRVLTINALPGCPTLRFHPDDQGIVMQLLEHLPDVAFEWWDDGREWTETESGEHHAVPLGPRPGWSMQAPPEQGAVPVAEWDPASEGWCVIWRAADGEYTPAPELWPFADDEGATAADLIALGFTIVEPDGGEE